MINDYLSGLNPEQYSAVTATEGFVRVIAGAGSGKTRALAHRFAFLVEDIGIPPSRILCVTFTNKAAAEMKQRIRSLIGDADLGHVCTFHAFCVTVLKEDIHTLSFPKAFVVLDREDENSILRTVYEECGFTSRDMTFRAAQDMIEIVKNLDKPDYYKQLLAMDYEEPKKLYINSTNTRDRIFWGYVYYQKRSFGLDYDDLIILTLHIFDEHPDIREKWQERLEYIMVDEFQDIDQQQYDLASVLCNYHNNLFIVGDPDQTVYSWRGANVRYINDFDKNYPGTRTIFLNRNYRSTPEITAAANSLISKNVSRIEKSLIPERVSGLPVLYNHLKTTGFEAGWIACEIKQLIESGVSGSDIAVLYRAQYVSRAIEEEFIKAGILYRLFSGVQFYCRKEIKDTLSYLRMVAYHDDLSFERIINEPKRNIGERRMNFLKEYAEENGVMLYSALKLTAGDGIWSGTDADDFIALVEKYSKIRDNMSVSELLTSILDESGYEESMRRSGAQDRLDNVAELKQSIYDYEATCGEEVTLDEFLAKTALYTNADDEAKPDTVRMMTVHSAKGLEFKYVFLCGMNEGIFPSKKINTAEKLEEERRLAYVAVTRARDGLYITDSEGFNHDGSFRLPSRFILNIDRQYIQYVTEPDEKLLFEAKSVIANSEKLMLFDIHSAGFSVGDRIHHFVMGLGTIVGINDKDLCYVIKFDDLPTTRNISARVKLTKVC